MKAYPLIVCIAAWLCGCAAQPPSLQHACSEPRPQICTMEYAPVCALRDDGKHKSYASGCVACADPRVIGYDRGPCRAEKAQ